MTAPSSRPERPPRTAPEWWTFGVAIALIAAVVGVILVSWATGPSGPPVLRVERSGPVERSGDAYRVPFEASNEGGEAAASVQVVAELTIDGRLEGEGEQSIAFLSGGERESGAFLFAKDPTDGELTLSVASYASP